MKVRGRNYDGATVWLDQSGYWVSDSFLAADFHKSEADRRLRVINANNRFLDREDRVEAEVESN
jgi:hypothetical protein